MAYEIFFFYIFSALLLFSSFRVITAHNTVHAVLYLMFAFSQAASIWLLLNAEFLAISLILVYLGAVMVLFLFSVMMLDTNIRSAKKKDFWKHVVFACIIGAIFISELILIQSIGFDINLSHPASNVLDHMYASNTKSLGFLLYTEYLYPIQIAAVILLVAMIAAIALTLRQTQNSKGIDTSAQIRVKPQERLTLASNINLQKRN